MNVLFLTLVEFDTIQEHNIYSDLLREFVKNGHEVFVISPSEKRENKPTHVVKEDHATILRLQIGNTQKTNIIEKGISTLLIESQFKAGIKKYFSNVKFDLVLYSTPPITLVSAVEYVKKRDGAKTYLLLKDIFPQNAVDIGLMSKTGAKGLLYKYFRRKEKKLYQISDRIGCIINTASSVDHDCVLSDFVHVAVGAHLCGTVTIGNATWIGAGATVSNNVNICGECTIGAGAVVVKDIIEPGTYIGVPAKLRRRD